MTDWSGSETTAAPAAAAPKPQRLRARLLKDLKEFMDAPYPGCDMHVHDALDSLCLILTPQDGPLRGLRLHFQVILPNDWPASPPQVKSSTNLAHPNIFGSFICCDLLRMPYSTTSTGYKGGYTPAFTLRALSIQLLSFFASRLVEQDHGGNVNMGDEILTVYHQGELSEEALYSLSYHSHGDYYDRGNTSYKDSLEKEFNATLKTSKSHKQFKYLSDWENFEVTSQDKAGRWQGWCREEKEKAPIEVEIVKLLGKRSDLVRLRKRNPRWTQSYNCLQRFKCEKCNYNMPGGNFKVVDEKLVTPLKYSLDRIDGNTWTETTWDQDRPSASNSDNVSSITPSTRCYLDSVNDDVLLCLTDHMSSESIISFNAAYPRFKALTNSAHVLILRELECFFLRTPLKNSILGVGVHVEAYQKSLSSSFDVLSFEAFHKYKVRMGIDKSPFEHFLPLYFSRDHFSTQTRQIALENLQKLQQAISLRAPPNLRDRRALAWSSRLRVILKFMNNVVVDLMKSADELLPAANQTNEAYSHDPKQSISKKTLLIASEKSISAYFQLFQLLRNFAGDEYIKSCNGAIEKFRTVERARWKDQTPDLGELIIMVCLVANNQRKDIREVIGNFLGPFLEEIFTRNVRWVLEKEPDLSYLEKGTSDARVRLTFQHSKTSQRLVMFQVFFCRFIAQYGPMLNANFGYPPTSVGELVVKEIKSIYAVDGFRSYFTKIGYTRGLQWTKDQFCEKLKGRVAESLKRRYHDNNFLNKAAAEKEMERKRGQGVILW